MMKNGQAEHPESIVEIRMIRHISRINHLHTAKLIFLICIIALTGIMISIYGKSLKNCLPDNINNHAKSGFIN